MQLRRIGLPLVVSLACSWLGCKSKDPSAQGAASASSQPASVTSTTMPSATASNGRKPVPKTTPWAAIPSATAVLLPNMGFGERFEIESKSRPPGIKPNAEEVFAAIEAAGVHLVEKKQHLASPFGARYCIGARAVPAGKEDETLYHLSVCEFISEEVAKMSRDYSDESLAKTIPDRSVYANKQTTLTLREMNKSPDTDAIGAKMVDAYNKLGH